MPDPEKKIPLIERALKAAPPSYTLAGRVPATGLLTTIVPF